MIANNPAPLARTASLDDTMRLAETFCRSGFFSDAREAAQAVVKIIAGQELGFGPMASMTGVHVIKGKVALSSNLLGAAIKRSGRYDYRVVALDDDRAVLAFFENGEAVGESSFTMDDAKRAGLLANTTWKSYPRNMLLARALSNGARWYCPDVFGGAIYTPDELGAVVDGETGEVLDHAPRADSRPALPRAADDAPEHWTPLIDAAETSGDLLRLATRIETETPAGSSRDFRVAGALRRVADRIADPDVTTMAELARIVEWLDTDPAGAKLPFCGELGHAIRDRAAMRAEVESVPAAEPAGVSA